MKQNTPYRQIHLDFHTSPHIPDVARDFDPHAFAATFKRARANSVTLFAKCHHGHLYYNTPRPERHPSLPPNLDLLALQIESLHKNDIRAPLYISVLWDEFAADAHPEWVARHPDGKPVGAGPLYPGWQTLDMASPYQEYLAQQTKEILDRFHPVDGVFFDICWDQPSLNPHFVDAMLRANLNPDLEPDRGKYARTLAHQYMKRFHGMVKKSSKHASVFFNGRPFTSFPDDRRYITQAEIEALPTGGWGYTYFPKNVRYVRTFDKPYIGMTARFHKSWGDIGGLKPLPALLFETAQMIAHGARCSIGDQLHPRGALDQPAYDLIAQAYQRVEAAEPWLHGATPLAQVGLFQLPTASLHTTTSTSGTDEGATRMLTQLKHQFNVLNPQSDLAPYDLLVLPDFLQPDPALIKRLRAYLKRGGKILATGHSGLSPDATQLLLPELAIKPHGKSPFTTTYFRPTKQLSRDLPETDHVMYDPGLRVTPAKGAAALARVVEPYFERSWRHFSSHRQTPPDKPTKYAAATLANRCAYIAYPVFTAYATHGNAPYRILVRNLIDKLLPDPLLRVDAPTATEATVTRQKNRTIVHLLHFPAERRAKDLDLIEDIVPLYNVPLSLRATKPPRRVYLAPENLDLDFEHLANRINLRVPQIRGHQMVVFE